MARNVQNLEESFEQIVPAAAEQGAEFLEVVQALCRKEGLDLNFELVKPRRREERYVLQANFRLGDSWARGKGSKFYLEVYADPIGSSLQVGWQLTKDVISGVGSRTVQGNLDRLSSSPEPPESQNPHISW